MISGYYNFSTYNRRKNGGVMKVEHHFCKNLDEYNLKHQDSAQISISTNEVDGKWIEEKSAYAPGLTTITTTRNVRKCRFCHKKLKTVASCPACGHLLSVRRKKIVAM